MTDLCLTQTDLQIQHNSKSSPHRAPGGNPDPKDLITLLYGRASKTLLEKGHSVPQTECWTRWGIGFSRPSPQYVGDKDIWQQNPKRTQSLHLITQMSKELQRTQNHRSPIKMSRSLSPGREGTRQDTRSRRHTCHLPPPPARRWDWGSRDARSTFWGQLQATPGATRPHRAANTSSASDTARALPSPARAEAPWPAARPPMHQICTPSAVAMPLLGGQFWCQALVCPSQRSKTHPTVQIRSRALSSGGLRHARPARAAPAHPGPHLPPGLTCRRPPSRRRRPRAGSSPAAPAPSRQRRARAPGRSWCCRRG